MKNIGPIIADYILYFGYLLLLTAPVILNSCALVGAPPPNPCAKVTVIIEGTIVEPVESGVSEIYRPSFGGTEED